YARAFLRSNDYLGIQVRLTIIFILIIMLVSANPWITAALTVFTVFITGIQLLPLFGHFHHLSLQELYPVNQKAKLQSFFSLMKSALTVQALLFCAASAYAAGVSGALYAAVASAVLIFVIMPSYMGGRLKKYGKL
ncbi:ABC transporter permease, partial [Bacillus velezensis]